MRYFIKNFAAAGSPGTGADLKTPSDALKYKQSLAIHGLMYHTSAMRKEAEEANPQFTVALTTQPAQVLASLAVETRLAIWESRVAALRRVEAEAKAKALAAAAEQSRAAHLELVYQSQFDENGLPNFYRMWPAWVKYTPSYSAAKK